MDNMHFDEEIKDHEYFEEKITSLELRVKEIERYLCFPEKENESTNPILRLKIDDYNIKQFPCVLTVRTANCLMSENIKTIGDLIKCSEKDLLNMPNVGKKSLKEIKVYLEQHSLSLNNRDTLWKKKEKENEDG